MLNFIKKLLGIQKPVVVQDDEPVYCVYHDEHIMCDGDECYWDYPHRLHEGVKSCKR